MTPLSKAWEINTYLFIHYMIRKWSVKVVYGKKKKTIKNLHKDKTGKWPNPLAWPDTTEPGVCSLAQAPRCQQCQIQQRSVQSCHLCFHTLLAVLACAGYVRHTVKSQCLDKQMPLGQNEFFLAMVWPNQKQFSDTASQLKQQKYACIFFRKARNKGSQQLKKDSSNIAD